ncbi:phospholipase A2, minor isoenzyme-like isoform X1 [Mobula birostris]|uniref:phospholipase A2, minor isoenzyme-like isoform X1 n=1 Tax=Mobula birostris TaxID=1983395 RepID=UPI003B27E80B
MEEQTTMLGLFVLLLLSAGAESASIESRNLIQFSNMISCAIPGCSALLRFNDYGCYCGPGGSGTPVDDLDRCCQTHDNCYGDAENKENCKTVFSPTMVYYHWSCSKGKIECGSNYHCAKFICECDRNAAICFSKAKYNPENKGISQSRCK